MGDGTLTAAGFDPKRLADVLAGMQEAFRDEFGQSINLDPSTEWGKVVGIFSSDLTEIWERLETDYNSHYPGTATGVSLDRVAEITAIVRNAAQRSTVTLYVYGINVTIPVGSIVETSDTAIQFRTSAEVVLGATGNIPLTTTSGVSIASITRVGTVATVTTTAPHSLPAGAVVTIAGATGGDAALYNVTAEIENIGGSTFDFNMVGTPGGSATGTLVFGNPGLASDHITLANATARSVAHGLTTGDYVFVHGADQDEYNGLFQVTVLGAKHFKYTPWVSPTVTPATGSYNADDAVAVAGESVNTGAIIGLADTLTVIGTPVSGWDGVNSYVDAELGQDEETDAEFRARRIAALQGLGNATVEAILGALLALADVTQARVFVNDTNDTVDGRLPHSFEALVVGGADQDIWDSIFLNKAAGINTNGSESGTSTDSQGVAHTIKFSRPSAITIYLDLTLSVNADYPANGDQLVEDLVNAWGDALGIGVDVVVYPYLVASFEEIPGITDVVVDIGTSISPSGDANIAIAETEIADFDSSRTTVTSS